jgi:high-affinity iron transporter
VVSRSASRRSLLAGLLVLAIFAGALAEAPGRPPPPDAPEAEPLVFLLQYLGDDYPEAVADGKILDDEEYRENRLFIRLILEKFGKLRDAFPAERALEIDGALARLARLVEERAEVGEIRRVVETIVPLVVERFGLRVYPAAVPDTRRAAASYAENCAVCHGDSGGGDGRAARDLRPVAARFDDREQMSGVAPSVLFNAISLGIPGTAMPSFGEALSDEDRWALTFYLWTFTAPRRWFRSGSGPVIPLRELATRSASDLAQSLVKQSGAVGKQEDEGRLKAEIAELRARPRLNDGIAERLSQMSFDVARSLELARSGERTAAADLIQASYIRQFEAIERPLFATAPTLSRQVNREMRGLFRAIVGGDASLIQTIHGQIERDLRSLRRRFEPSPWQLSRIGRRIPIVVGAGFVLLSLVLALRARKLI